MLDASKAKAGALVGAVAGFLAPGAAYLMTVDGDGLSGTELVHGLLISLVAAATTGAAVGATVWKVQNRPKV